MNLDDMKTLYQSKMGSMDALNAAASVTLRLWDGMDGVWCDVVTSVDLAFALRAWCERTVNGEHNTKYGDIDYYKIFPADTRMLYSDDFTMRGEE